MIPIQITLHQGSYDRLVTGGLEQLLREVFPPKSGFEYLGVALVEGRRSEEECVLRGETYAYRLRARVRIPQGESTRTIGELPRWTDRGTLIVRGLERVPLVQLRLRPGLYFSVSEDSRRVRYWARLIPCRGFSIRFSLNQEAGEWRATATVGGSSMTVATFLARLGLLEDAVACFGADPPLDQSLKPGTRAEGIDLRLQAHFLSTAGSFDLSGAGRDRFNHRVTRVAECRGLRTGTGTSLVPGDLMVILAGLLALKEGTEAPDDLGDLQHRVAFGMGDHLRERLEDELPLMRRIVQNAVDLRGSPEPIFASLRGAFDRAVSGYLRSEFCQFLDCTNPLAEVCHKRKVTLLGAHGEPGKWTSRVLRGVHPSHYGRLCPLETPETESIGLDLYLSIHADITDSGVIVTPVQTADGEEVLLSPADEAGLTIGAAAEAPGADGILARQGAEIRRVHHQDITHRDRVPGQALGLAASLVPFLNHDDLNRGMMGAKNMKQALPLPRAEVPLVRTGVEPLVAQLSRRTLCAVSDGEVTEVTAGAIVVRRHDGGEDRYGLRGLQPTPQRTFVQQQPRVTVGTRVESDEVLADDAGIRDGVLALGVNCLVAYMPWRGYNFEDAIVVSDRLVRDDIFTSLHVQELSYEVRGDEVIRLHKRGQRADRDETLAHLSDDGLIREGSAVRPGTVLFRKWAVSLGWEISQPLDVTAPKGCQGTVLRALRVPIGASFGIAKAGLEVQDPDQVREIVRIWIQRECKLTVGDKLTGRHGNKGVVGRIVSESAMPHLPNGTPIDVILNPHGVVSRMNLGQLFETHLGWTARTLKCQFRVPPFGRIEVEACEDPALGERLREILAAAPDDRTAIDRLLELANAHGTVKLEQGKVRLRDGAEGDFFEAPVTVGVQYILKLNHLADTKLAARQEGDYAPVTGQPARGTGGQRLGEMEVWALEAHNAPHLLRESLTHRSDDVKGRARLWKRLGGATAPIHVTESLRATVMLLRGLALKVDLLDAENRPLELAYGATLYADDVHRVRISLASSDDIRRWGPKSITDPKALIAEAVPVFRCMKWHIFSGGRRSYVPKRRARRVRGNSRPAVLVSCPQCGHKAIRLGREVQKKLSPSGLFSKQIFGEEEGQRRLRMAHIRLAVPVVHPLFVDDLTRLCGRDLQALVGGKKVFLPESGRVVDCDGDNPPSEHVASAGEYARHILAGLQAQMPDSVPTPGEPSDRRGEFVDPTVALRAILDVVPVIPPDLRPLVRAGASPSWSFEDFTTALNRHYTQVFLANAQVRAELLRTPRRFPLLAHAIIELQRAVAALLVEGTTYRGRHYPGLGELVEGKEGVLRHALLGKRTNYSGRAVIIPDPALGLDNCGLPIEIGHRLLVSASKRPVASLASGDGDPQLREQIQKKLTGRVILLNRAPTLHRYNILTFEPRLIEGSAIALCPLVCGGFNADFDGDTMAVHFPIQAESQREARECCLPSRHLRSIASGRLLLHLTQDIIAGVYLGTRTPEGRCELARVLDDSGLPGLTVPLAKKELVSYLEERLESGSAVSDVVRAAEKLMRWGFEKATRAGLTLSIFDIPGIGPAERSALRANFSPTDWQAWSERVGDEIKGRLEAGLESTPPNPLSLLILSGARGDLSIAIQLGGLRMLERPGGGDFPEPLTRGFVEGLCPLEFFLSAFPARKTMVDKKLVVADAGTLTRRLVEAAYPLIIDQTGACADSVGIELRELDGLTPAEVRKLPPFERRLLGRVLLEPLSLDGDLLEPGTVLTSELVVKIIQSGRRSVRVRSPLTCRAENGLCQACYGWDPSTRDLPQIGLAVGVIAGQSIGERGTQLTMRTFHTGGVKGEDITKGLPRVGRLIEGWADLLRLKVRLNDGEERSGDEWAMLSVLAAGHAVAPPEPVVGASGRPATVSLHLDDIRDRDGLAAVHALFSWVMHRIYEGAVDDRHIEVILRAMLVNGRVQGVSRAAARRCPGQEFLGAASFRSGLRVLVRAALEESTDPLVGYKARVMAGRAFSK